jgi:hypothetical protein
MKEMTKQQTDILGALAQAFWTSPLHSPEEMLALTAMADLYEEAGEQELSQMYRKHVDIARRRLENSATKKGSLEL